MIENDIWKNKKRFIGFYLIINAAFLIELLPNLGVSLPSTLSSRKVLLVLFVISGILLCYNHIIRKNSISTLFLVMNSYFLYITIINNSIQQQPIYYYFSAVMYPWIVTFISENLIQGLDNDIEVGKFVKLISLFSLLYVFLMFQYKLNIASTLTASGEASIYFVLTLLPFILCCSGKFRNILLVVVVISVFFTLKRTALIAIVASFFAYLIARFRNHDEKKFKLVLYGLAGAILFIAIYQIVVKYTGNDLLQKVLNTSEDGGSNRNYIYIAVLEKFNSLSLIEKIFGIGYNGVRYGYNIVSAGTVVSSHNDFLEVLCDYGVIGLIMYLAFIIKLIKKYIVLKKFESPYAPAMAVALVLFFVLSMFSHLLLYTSYFMNLLLFFVMIEYFVERSVGRSLAYEKSSI